MIMDVVNTSLSLKIFVAFFFTIFHLTDSFYIAAPSNISVFNKTSTSLLISWEAVAYDTIFGYRMRHRPNSTSAFHMNAITDSTSNSSNGNRSCYDNNSSIFVCENRTSVLLTDLQVYTYYWVNVIAFTNETFGNDSRTGVFRTDEGVPTSPPLNITGEKQNSTRITLSWEAVPIQHQRGEIINYVVKVVKSDGGNVTQYNATTLGLDIGGLEKFTFYSITVSASTSKGTSNASSVFQIRTAEDAPDDPPVNINATVVSHPNITSDYIIITWESVVGKLNGILRAYVIRWRPARENASYTEKRVNVTESRRRRRRSIGDVYNERTFKITNLSIYTNYSVEVAAFTVKRGVYSAPKYFLSQEGVPLLPPGNVTAVNTSSTVIRVTWSRPKKSSIRGKLIGYEITFTPASKNASASQRVMLCANASYYLEKLSKYTLYNITVAAFTKVGIGNESKIEQAWTDEDVPDVGPVIVRAESTTFSSINVDWKIIPKEERNGHITMYEVDVLQQVGGTWETQLTNNFTKNLTAEIQNAVIQNLTMFVKYRIRVRAYTCKGPGPYSNQSKMLMTLETAPSVVPTNLTAYPTSRTEVHVSWKIEGLEPGFKLRHYVVWYRKLHGENNKTIRSNPNVTEADLTGLSPFTTYEIKVAAATNFTGSFSEPINVTTKEGVPQGAPVNVTAVSETHSSIRVSWKPVPKEQQNGTITHYNVTVANSSSEQVFRSVNVSAWNVSVVIDNLEMYVTYLFEVQAFTKAGPGPFSQSVNGTTIQQDPYVVVNVTAEATSSNSINLTGDIVEIHDQLIPNGIRIRYCEMKRNHQDNKRDGLDYSCKGCKDKNVTDINSGRESLTDLRGHTIHRITAQAINIVAKDGTVVIKRYGNESDPIYIKTLEREPGEAPSNVTASPHSTTSIKVEWDPVPKCKRNGEITNYIVEVFNSTRDEVRYVNVSSDDRSVVIRNLQEYTNYSVLVYATTAVGEGPPSEYQNTTTHQPAPKTIPENVTAEPTGNSTILVKWSSIGISSSEGFRGFSVRYEAEGHANRNGEKETGKIYNITLTELRMFTTYNIQVAARTTQPGNYSKAVSATTLEGVPTKPPNDIDPNILGSIVEISWGEVPEESRNGEILGYRITYYKANNQTYKKTLTNPADFFTVQLKSLGKFSEYYVEILAYTKAGNGKVGNTSFRTSDDIPSKPPRNLKASSFISPYKIQVTWEPVPPGFMNGQLLSYHVTYQRVMVGGVRKDFEQELQKTVSGRQNVKLDNLEPYSKYKIRVAAKTLKGLGPYTAFVYGETCHCLGRLTTSWRRYAPYVNFTDDGKPGHIIPLVLQSMVKECCGHCLDPNQTVLDFGTNGKNEPSAKNSSRKLLEEINELTDFTFPVFGHKDQDSYKGGFGYTPVIESAGVAFIVYPDVSTSQTTMFQAMINCLPVFILPIVTAYIAGVIIWCLERKNNAQDFPQSFLQGTWEGIWWSFVSMTTLGYGDRAPLSYKGRIFAIAWILFGLIVIAITMAMITTTLTVVSVDSEIKLYGSKIAAEYNSPEYNLGTRRNARYDPDKEYHSIEEVAEALVNRDVEGVLVDTYTAGLKSDLFDHPPIRVSSVLDYKSAYGIVLSPKSTRLGKCFERYMLSHRAEIFKMIETKVKPIETSSSSADKQAEEENSGGLLDSGSPMFRRALRYGCVMLGIALGLSLVYECIRCMRARQKVRAEVYFKTILLREMQSLIDEFIHRVKQAKAKLGERHRKQIVRFWKLKRKSMCSSGNESEWLRISTASPHRGEVTVTDL